MDHEFPISLLRELNKNLTDIPPGDKKQIVELVHQDYERKATGNQFYKADYFIEEFGSVEDLINHYRRERNYAPITIKTKRNKTTSSLKKGCLTILVIFMLICGFLYYKFTPILEVDKEKGKLTILGGLIEMDEKSGRFTFFNQHAFVENQDYHHNFKGEQHLAANQKFKLLFNSGILNLSTSKTNKLIWNCQLSIMPGKEEVTNDSDKFVFNFTKMDRFDCKISVPQNAIVQVKGQAGKVKIDQPIYDLKLNIGAGSVFFFSDKYTAYDYDVYVSSGTASKFNSDIQTGKKYKIDIEVDSGFVRSL